MAMGVITWVDCVSLLLATSYCFINLLISQEALNTNKVVKLRKMITRITQLHIQPTPFYSPSAYVSYLIFEQQAI